MLDSKARIYVCYLIERVVCMESRKFDPDNIKKLLGEKRQRDLPAAETLGKFIQDKAFKGTFVDYGCGPGYFTFAAERFFTTVIGVDVQVEMINYALKHKPEGSTAKFMLSHEFSTALPDASADVIFIANVMHEVDDTKRIKKELKRLLKEDGEIWIIEWLKKEMAEGPPLDIRLSFDDLKDIITDEELSIVEKIDLGDRFYGVRIHKNEELFMRYYKDL